MPLTQAKAGGSQTTTRITSSWLTSGRCDLASTTWRQVRFSHMHANAFELACVQTHAIHAILSDPRDNLVGQLFDAHIKRGIEYVLAKSCDLKSDVFSFAQLIFATYNRGKTVQTASISISPPLYPSTLHMRLFS